MNKRNVLVLVVGLLACAINATGGVIMVEKTNLDLIGLGGQDEVCTMFFSGEKARVESKATLSEIMGILMEMPVVDHTIEFKQFGGDTLIKADVVKQSYKIINISDATMPLPEDTNVYVSFEVYDDHLPNGVDWIESVDSTSAIDTINGYPCRYIKLQADGTISSLSLETMIQSTLEAWISSDVPGAEYYVQNDRLEQRMFAGKDNSRENGLFDIMIRQTLQLMDITIKTGEVPVRRIWRIRVLEPEMDTLTDEHELYIRNIVLPEWENPTAADEAITKLSQFYGRKSEDGMIDYVRSQSDLISVEEKDLPDSLFEIPEGYTEKEFEP